MRVLLVEDDQRLTGLLAPALEGQGYRVDVTNDGAAGLEQALTGNHSVAVVDWMLPGRDGPAICRAIRNAKLPVAVLMLTSRTQIEDRVIGLDSGADDYLTKPFALEELFARIRSLGRRVTPNQIDSGELRCGDLTLDLPSHTAHHGSQPLYLSLTEWQMLECFMRHPRQTLSREQLFSRVWDATSNVQLSMVDVYVSYLRRKLRAGASQGDIIETVRGVGYRLNSKS